MKRAPIFLLVFFAGIAADRLLIPSSAQAQTRKASSLAIDGIPVTVGMSRAAAVAALSGYTVTNPVANNRALIVKTIPGRGGAFQTMIPGSLVIEEGIVTQITRDWGEGERGPEVERVWKSLWGALTSTIPDSTKYTALSISASAQSSPQAQTQTINVLVGAGHLVSIQRVELSNQSGILASPSGPVVSVDETVF
jgi:hypothetical protein